MITTFAAWLITAIDELTDATSGQLLAFASFVNVLLLRKWFDMDIYLFSLLQLDLIESAPWLAKSLILTFPCDSERFDLWPIPLLAICSGRRNLVINAIGSANFASLLRWFTQYSDCHWWVKSKLYDLHLPKQVKSATDSDIVEMLSLPHSSSVSSITGLGFAYVGRSARYSVQSYKTIP